MSDTPTRFPLSWPKDRPRKPWHTRKSGNYKSDGNPITTAVAMDRLDDEVRRLGGRETLLSTNVDTTLSGRPRSGAAQPTDPGVCLYFKLNGKPMVMACDTFDRVEQNIAALAAHIEATRKIDRLGVATADEMMQAFQALPPPSAISLPAGSKPWREVMGFETNWPPPGHDKDWALHCIRKRYRARAIEANGDADLAELNIARDAALKELG